MSVNMVNVRIRKKYYVASVIILVLNGMAVFSTYLGTTYIGWCANFVRFSVVIPLFGYLNCTKNRVFKAYFVTMSVGLFFHCLLPNAVFYENIIEFLSWVVLVYLLVVSSRYDSRCLKVLALGFFCVNCGVSFFERITEMRLIVYDNDILNGFIDAGNSSSQEFRSFGLLGHPLANACVISLFMGMILVYHQMKASTKLFLLIIGMIGLYGFNSRGAILVWIIILLFRFALYKKNFLKTVIPLSIIVFAFPFFVDYVNSGALGRFSFDFSDGSSATRWESFLFFVMQDWNLETILLGGRYIKMPGTDLLLENGILLNLSYWGWVVGVVKTVLEVLITFTLFRNRPKQEIFIVMFSYWGVALTNNIITGVLPLTFFLFAYSALGYGNYSSCK